MFLFFIRIIKDGTLPFREDQSSCPQSTCHPVCRISVGQLFSSLLLTFLQCVFDFSPVCFSFFQTYHLGRDPPTGLQSTCHPVCWISIGYIFSPVCFFSSSNISSRTGKFPLRKDQLSCPQSSPSAALSLEGQIITFEVHFPFSKKRGHLTELTLQDVLCFCSCQLARPKIVSAYLR